MAANATFTGDEIVPDAVMIYDEQINIHATKEDSFPWLLQLGKGRGGWYLTSWVETFLPRSWRAARTIEEKWQHLEHGQRVEDYGLDANEDYLVVNSIAPPHALVFESTRYGCHFSWALLLHDLSHDDHPNTVLHLRFRGKIQATGFKRWLIVKVGGFMDHISTRPMLAGLKERAEQHSAKHGG